MSSLKLPLGVLGNGWRFWEFFRRENFLWRRVRRRSNLAAKERVKRKIWILMLRGFLEKLWHISPLHFMSFQHFYNAAHTVKFLFITLLETSWFWVKEVLIRISWCLLFKTLLWTHCLAHSWSFHLIIQKYQIWLKFFFLNFSSSLAIFLLSP